MVCWSVILLLYVWATATVGAAWREQVRGSRKICAAVVVACRQRLDLKLFEGNDERQFEVRREFDLSAGAVAAKRLPRASFCFGRTDNPTAGARICNRRSKGVVGVYDRMSLP
jgi:hypothetical protein